MIEQVGRTERVGTERVGRVGGTDVVIYCSSLSTSFFSSPTLSVHILYLFILSLLFIYHILLSVFLL